LPQPWVPLLLGPAGALEAAPLPAAPLEAAPLLAGPAGALASAPLLAGPAGALADAPPLEAVLETGACPGELEHAAKTIADAATRAVSVTARVLVMKDPPRSAV